jgi:hypothetical protein
MIVVMLTWPEMCMAAVVGVLRQVQNMKRKAQQRYGAPHELSWQQQILGCIGECALAKHLDRFWSGAVGNYEAADVGGHCQVRATAHPAGRLILHPDDNDRQPFVLARVDDNRVTLVGWMLGGEGKRDDYWQEPQPGRPAFLVPNDVLHDMNDFNR